MRRLWGVAAGLVALAGCAKLGDLEGLKDLLPKVSFSKLRVDAISFEKVDTTFLFAVENPYPVTVDLDSFRWDLDLQGTDLAEGKNAKGATIKGEGSSKLRIPVSVGFPKIFELAKGAKGLDEIPFRIKGDVAFATPIGPVKVPFEREGGFPVLHTPRFKLKGLRVTKLDVAKHTADLALDLGVSTEQKSKIGLPAFTWGVSLGGKAAVTGKAAVPEFADGTTVQLPMQIDLLRVGTAIAQVITKKEALDVALGADASVATPWGAVPLRVDEKAKLDLQ